MKKTKNKIICLVGESGSGKTSLYDLLREKGYSVIDSYTTRPPRKPNELGHTFVTEEGFDAIRSDLAAYTEFSGYEYGTTFKQIENGDFYIIDPAGVKYFSEKIGRDNFVVVYVCSSEIARFERMEKERGEHHACKRIYHDRQEFRNFLEYEDWDYIIHNEFPEQLDSNIYFLERLFRNIK